MSPLVVPDEKIIPGLGAQIGRRKFLQLVGAGAATTAAGGIALWLIKRPKHPVRTSTAYPTAPSAGSRPAKDVVIALTASPDTIALFPGAPTNVWKYTGKVVEGDPGSLQAVAGSYLGPTLHLHKGQKVRRTYHSFFRTGSWTVIISSPMLPTR